MTREATRPGAEFKMAAAGPACSLAIGGLFALLWFFSPDGLEPITAMASWLSYINVALAIFNLIPGFPLDGGRVFRSLIWRFSGNYRGSTRVATLVGRSIGYLFILGGILIILFRPAGLNWFSGLWLAFIGWFLENAASASYHQVRQTATLQGLKVSQVMNSNYPVVPPDITISQLVQEYVFLSGQRFFLVASQGRMEGILTLENIKSVARENWQVKPVEEIMTPVDRLVTVSPDQDTYSALEQMGESGTSHLLVVNEGRIIGIVVRENLLNLLRTRSELGYNVDQ
jgi:CBS domain-containing protein